MRKKTLHKRTLTCGSRRMSPGSGRPDGKGLILLWLLWLVAGTAAGADDLPATIREVRPCVVGVGTYMVLRRQQDKLLGTGFVVGTGNYVLTNAHVVPRDLDAGRRETAAVYIPAGGTRAQRRPARVVKRDPVHDLCLLRFEGPAARALRLGRAEDVQEGEAVAFTGFPILNALGLHPVTHRGIVSAITPYVVPVNADNELRPDVLRKLARPFEVFQLDATAYPGNSGSPLYEVGSGRVIGIINSVFVKATKEMAITAPSGITYAIPVTWMRKLLDRAGIKY
jgi:S1-C subfamily serine protease